MARSGDSPPRYSRLDTDPDEATTTLSSPGPAGSPACRDSPWSVGASALSSSPTSTTFLSLAGAAAGTPLSSLDGEEPASRIAADGPDKMENESLLAWAEPPRSQKGEASPVASAPSAPRSPAAMAQSPERNRGQHAPQAQLSTQNTRLQNSLLPSNSTPSTASVSAASAPVPVPVPAPAPPLVRPSFTTAPPPPPEPPAIVRTTSSHGDLPLRHPVPDPNARSGALVGNVAQLEASAEQLAQFDSIEDAIREAHEELKRSDSRRSSLLAASVRRTNSTRAASDTSDPASVYTDGSAAPSTSAGHRPPRPQLLRAYSGHSSIIELNSAARSGGFSPHDYMMSPASSLAGSVLQRTTSNGSASGSVHGSASGANILGISDQSITAGGDDYFPFLSRHGTGKSSMRSVRSGKMSLPEIAELEPPTTLTQAALDEADRMLAAGLPLDEDDHTLRFADHPDTWPAQPMAASTGPDASMPPPPPPHITPAHQPYSNPQEALHDGDNQMGPDAPAYHLPEQATNGGAAAQYDASGQERPTTSASTTTFEQAQHAFRDFDGVHCDPDEAADQVPELPRYGNPSAANEAQPSPAAPLKSARPQPPPPRPTSYLDPATGRQMLYYPAPVPAMLQLPAKLSKSTKAGERRSQVMSMMAQARQEPTLKHERQSWLPDLTTGSDIGSLPYNRSGSLVPDGLSSPSHSTSQHDFSARSDGGSRADNGPTNADVPGEGSVGDDAARTTMNLRRPSRILDVDKRKSRMSTALDKLPPQLRAAAYFDLPSTTTGASIEAKNGSAMDTLDSILDAAAHAPISAFTDHAFAGHLGAEVYGRTKKRNRKKANSLTLGQLTGATAAAEKDARRPQLRGSRSRSSFFGLVGNIRKVSASVDGDHDDAPDAGRVVSSGGRSQRRRSQALDRDGALTPGLSDGGGGLLAPGDDERLSDDEEEHRRARAHGLQPGEEDEDEDDDDEEDDENLVDGYLGAPTTLLAELQLRKQQQKQRTRPITSAFPNGMHSTLLELDAVAEVERRARRGKKVNLAWEDPIAANDGDEDMDNDEDVPLGLLYAAKAAGNNDIVAASADLSRPLGLMEKKELEDNEPLSRRRDRLQGRDPGAVSMYLSGGNALKRQSVLALKPISAGQGGGSAGAGADAGSDASEVEDEPLAARRNRMKARRESELPLARPVSTTFSAELLSQFGDLEVDKNDKDAAKQDSTSPRPEEEETLGQRRRRLQAEKEAREQEMLGGGGGGGGSSGLAVNDQALHALTGSSRLSRRLSMADLLAAAPAGPAKGGQPTGARRDSRIPSGRTMTMSQADLGRAAHGQWGSMGMMGSASAAHLPSMGPMGGHMGMNMGPQNGMMGGAVPYGGAGMNGMGGMMGMNNNPYGNAMAGGFMPGYNSGFGGFGGRGMPLQMPMGMGMPMPMPMQTPMGMPRQMPMGTMQPPQVQIDRVERWRQGVYP